MNEMIRAGTGCSKYRIGDRKRAWSNINLLESLFEIKRESIKNKLWQTGLKASSYKDVALFIRNNIK